MKIRELQIRKIISASFYLLIILLCVIITLNIGCTSHFKSVQQTSINNLPLELESQLKTSVEHLASTIGERNLYHPDKLNSAADWIENQFIAAGYTDVKKLAVPVKGSDYGLPADTTTWNVEAILPGTSKPTETIVIGAHYDTKVAMPGWHDHWPPESWKPGTPGANDNASGIAALLSISAMLRKAPHERTIRFVAFTNEEPPFYQSESMGSYAYARMLSKIKDHSFRMISLETMGCYSERQRDKRNRLVSLLGLADRSDYVAFLGNLSSRKWVDQSAQNFSPGPVELRTIVFPDLSDKIAWSDDWSFWQFGYPAFAITDTAFLRNDDYHETGDTADKLDYSVFAKVVAAVASMLEKAANDSRSW